MNKIQIKKDELTKYEKQYNCISLSRLLDILFNNKLIYIDNKALNKIICNCNVCIEHINKSKHDSDDDDEYIDYYQYAIINDYYLVEHYDLLDKIPFDIFSIEELDLFYIAFGDFGTNRRIVHGLSLNYVELV